MKRAVGVADMVVTGVFVSVAVGVIVLTANVVAVEGREGSALS